tara:strand:- start:1032 stop:3314 length:2283 start_codon:yes stop_codon:yes gene_type:complete
MPLSKIQFRPGVNRESTSFADQQGWFDSDLIRFRKGYPEKIGGWIKVGSSSVAGTVRSLKVWVTLSALKLMGVGTTSKFYIEQGTVYNDITPIRSTATLGANPITTGDAGSGVVTVTAAGHGAGAGDYVTFSGATTVDGLTIAQLNKEHEITEVVSSGSYKLDTGGSASSGGTSGGGSAVIANYQISVGSSTLVLNGPGWGAGYFGGETLTYSLTTLDGAINSSVTSVILTSASDFEAAASTTGAIVAVVDESINVADSSGFPEKGTVKINSENIIYNTNVGNVLGDLTRGADGTTIAAHGSGVAVTFVGLIQIDNELIQYTGKSSQTLDAGVARGARGTTAAAHSDGALVKEANGFYGWGNAVEPFGIAANARLWSQDNWGEDLVINVRDSTVYYWDATLGLSSRAVALSALSGASGAPTISRQVLVSDTDRHVICMGANTLGTTVQDLMLVRWSDQENAVDWTPTATNTAGSLRLSSGSEIITAVETRQQILIWTDASLYSMRFVGPPFTFSITLLANNVSIISPNAVVSVGDRVYWMDTENFFMYGGQMQTIPCTVLRYVFDDINLEQRSQFFAGSNRMFNEVFWFYCSSDSVSIDRYAKFNYADNTWDIGSLSRTAWVDLGLHENPRAAGEYEDANFVYTHETGTTADGEAMAPFIESSVFSIGDGEQFSFISRIIPDLDLTSSDANTSVNYIIKTRDYPGEDLSTNSTSAVTSTTQQSFVRSRARSAALRIESSASDIAWTLGDVRLDVRPDGRR